MISNVLAMTSLVSIAAAAASIQYITPDGIAAMSAARTPFYLYAGDLTQEYPIPAELLTLQMEAAMDGTEWSVEFDPNYTSLELFTSKTVYNGEKRTKTYSWSISAGYDVVKKAGLIFTQRIRAARSSYWVPV